MWDGRPETRADSKCPFCDTDFLSKKMMSKNDIMEQVKELAMPGVGWVWISGGEPALQLDKPLALAIKQQGFKIGVETNGTRLFPEGTLSNIDHLTMSPKLPDQQTKQRWCDSLKLLYPHPNPLIRPEGYLNVRTKSRWLQPIEAEDADISKQNMELTLSKLYSLPKAQDWRLSVQTHKVIGVE
tara:strand:+ start:3952 stop:4503 length:552 start_codon:yes stop_codon:yes gene_type:complete